MMDSKRQTNYLPEDIVAGRHPNLSQIRRRPRAYLGGTDVAALIEYAVEDIIRSVDSTYSRIEVWLDRRGRTIRIVDDDASWQPNLFVAPRPLIAEWMTELRAGDGWGYRGENLSVINAMSEWLELRVQLPSIGYAQRFSDDAPADQTAGQTCAAPWAEMLFTPRLAILKRRFPQVAEVAKRLQKRLQGVARVAEGLGFILIIRPVGTGKPGIHQAFRAFGEIAAQRR
jgi:DNA gyrase/topoisomerase IV subunit B